MLFAVERLSERSEDWPTNKKFLNSELNIRAAGLARRRQLKAHKSTCGSFRATAKSITTSAPTEL